MTGIDDRPVVVVGVSPSASGRAALRCGVEQAARRGATVMLVRAWRDIDRLYSMSPDEVRGLGRAHAAELQILDDAVTEARRLDAHVDVRAQLVPEDVYPALLSAAAHADLLVLGNGTDTTRSNDIGEWFVAHAPCATEIVPAADATTAG